ncbi:MAG: AAA family ATPase [Candidatus Melainabacteria bacterium]|nr:AAA family ATPase [Candidatus Melainabacteria bacterium]
MLKVVILTQENESKFWQDTFANVWEGPVDISFQKDFQVSDKFDLIVLDFSGRTSGALNVLSDVSSHLSGKHFLIVSDTKDADIAIEALKLGAIGFLVKPFRRFELINCLDRLHTAPKTHAPVRSAARIVTLLSYKGGTGVSTTTVNLGYALASLFSKKVLLIDTAGFSNHVTVLLNVIPKCTLADICKQGNNLDEQYLMNAVSKVGNNLSIIGGMIKPSDFSEISVQGLEHLLNVATELYDYILVDTSTHMLDELTMFFIQKANDLLLMTTFDLLAIRDNRFYIQTLKEQGVLEHRIKPIVNRQDWYIGSLEPELIQKQINHPIFHSLPNDWQACVEATNYGRPILDFAPNSKLATAYKILASKISKIAMPEAQVDQMANGVKAEAKDPKKKGILHWF